MEDVRDRIRHNLHDVLQRIRAAEDRAGRAPGSARLVAVTKSVGLAEVHALIDAGISEFGENRPLDARSKIEAVQGPVCWHMIGSVQRRKAAEVVDLFGAVDSVDRIELADALEKRCTEVPKSIEVLFEVNVSGEASKHGFSPDEVPGVLAQSSRWPHLRVRGLMTMAPFVDNPEEVRPLFRRLRELADDLGLPDLSMGMSNDYEAAVEEGATQVRIGTALFI